MSNEYRSLIKSYGYVSTYSIYHQNNLFLFYQYCVDENSEYNTLLDYYLKHQIKLDDNFIKRMFHF